MERDLEQAEQQIERRSEQPEPPARQDVTRQPMRSSYEPGEEPPVEAYERVGGVDPGRPTNPQNPGLDATPIPTPELDGGPAAERLGEQWQVPHEDAPSE